ncbi:MAG: SDR family oxidoreductase [Candidatus Hodarchaeales archaeon]|jgi:NADP-dependent 3-hydroxy acid dehydrogenase YdfG
MKALVTGASSGIGEAIVETFAKMKIDVYLTGRNEQRLKKVEKMVKSFGVDACYAVGDVKNSKDVERIYLDAKEKMGIIDVLVANAGVGYFNNLELQTEDEFDKMFDTNVKGVFNWIRTVLPEMKERNSGQIIVISSTAGLNVYPRGGLYCATKHAVQAMTETLRVELEKTRIKVSTINPGAVDTPWFDKRENFDNEKRKTMLKAQDVANAAKLLVEQADSSNIAKIVMRY